MVPDKAQIEKLDGNLLLADQALVELSRLLEHDEPKRRSKHQRDLLERHRQRVLLVTLIDRLLKLPGSLEHIRKFRHLAKNHPRHRLVVTLECIHHPGRRRDRK